MTKGWKTSEFWTMVLSTAVSLGVMFGVIRPEAQQNLTGAVVTIIGAFFAILPQLWYILSRTWLKGKDPITSQQVS